MTWKDLTLGAGIHVKHGFAFKGEHFVSDGQYVVLTPGNFHEVGGFRARPGKDRFYAGEIPEDYILHDGDLIVAMTEQGAGLLGSSALIPESNRYLHNQRLGLINEIKGDVFDKEFLFYLFNTRSVRGQISGSASGTKVKHTAPERIYRVNVHVPDIESQRKIAQTLHAYDALIANNRRRIKLLEQSARLLFRDWFVHLRYPGREHDTIVDGVPQGWMHKKIEEIAETIGGGTPSSSNSAYWENGTVTWFVPTDVTRNGSLILLDSERKISESGLANSSAKILPANAILMTSRASVGFFAIYDEGPCCTNQGFISVIPKLPAGRMFLLHNLMQRKEEIVGLAGGVTYKEINKSTFRAMSMLVPPRGLREQFEEFADDCLRQVRNLMKQNTRLTKARDLLLPRLMDGRIAV